MKFIEISFYISIVGGKDLNPECFYWKLRCQSVKVQDFWAKFIKILERKLIISCTAHRAGTQLVFNNSQLPKKTRTN